MTIDFKALAAPFDADEIEWLPGDPYEYNGQWQVRVMAYVNARAVMQRLDDVVGSPYWSDSYAQAPNEGSNRSIECRLAIYCDSEWVIKADVGVNSKDRTANQQIAEKGGYSDAFKRAAVKWGIGRYLYRLGAMRVNCTVKRKGDKVYIQKHDTPRLPSWALPKTTPRPAGGRRLDDPNEPRGNVCDYPLERNDDASTTTTEGDWVPANPTQFFSNLSTVGCKNSFQAFDRLAKIYGLEPGSIKSLKDLPDGVTMQDAWLALAEDQAAKEAQDD